MVPESDWAEDERDARCDPLRRLVHLHERDLHAHVPRGAGRRLARLYDGGATYAFTQPVLHWNVVSSWGAWTLAIFQIPFIFNFFWSIWKGEKTGANPWQATTIEWAAPSPPPHGNFLVAPEAFRGPYDYSVPGAAKDFVPQCEA